MSQRITLLVLAYIAGCASQAPVVEAEMLPVGSVPTRTSGNGEPYFLGNEPGPLGSSLAPLPSGSPPSSPSAVASGPFRPSPAPRASASFRPPIGRPPPPPRPQSGRGRIIIGRPLVVDGAQHVAPYTNAAPTATTEDIDALWHAARVEHASIAAFARTIAELMALGAPLSLLHETQAALADEIRHTAMTLALLERITGEARTIAALPAAILPLERSVSDFFRDVLHGGAVGETVAAAEADAQAEHATGPDLRAHYQAIANDEARHAALAFKTLRWLIAQRPELAQLMADERARLTGAERALTAPLFDAIVG